MDDGLAYPQLNLSVYVAGPPIDTEGFSWWLGRAGCREATSVDEADFVVFAGGPDVSPSFYGDSELPCSYVDEDRDNSDLALYQECVRKRIPMVGICRGAQFLWVMLGGRLYQDVNNHNDGEHMMHFFNDKASYRISSVHHQMLIPRSFDGFKLLGSSQNSTKRSASTHDSLGTSSDFEIYSVQKKGIVGIQGHPEYSGFPAYSRLCARVIDEQIYCSDHTVFEGDRLRVKEAFNTVV